MPHMLMKHDRDPKEVILDALGDLDGVEVFLNDVLVAVYQRPKETASGILTVEQYTQKEDIYQGKVALVVKVGPTAFQPNETVDFAGKSVKEGDWIAFMPSDGWPLSINKKACRMISDYRIRVRIAHPDIVY